PTTEIYPLSLHDALPISEAGEMIDIWSASELTIRRTGCIVRMSPRADFVSFVSRDRQHPHAGSHSSDQVHGGVIRVLRSRAWVRSEEHTSELQSRFDLVC